MLRLLSNPRAAAVLGCVAFLLIGWAGLLVPALIRSIERDFGQSDAGIGVFYLLFAAAYAAGSLGGGIVTERLGRRRVLVLAAVFHGLGLAALGIVPEWTAVLVAALPAGLGAGAIDGGVNGLILDLFPTTRGRALNTLHLFFSIGALASPLVVGQLVEAGAAWQAVVVGTALVALPVAGLFAMVSLPHGRHTAVSTQGALTARRLAFRWPLIALEIAIACYVASEIGVSNWLVRFLDAAPLAVATTGLSLFWAGLALGRLVSARISDRFDHLTFATVSITVAACATIAAVLVPSIGASIVLFAVVGFASGPVFPLIIAIGGERHPGRSAAVSGVLTGAAVAGSVLYPPVMGFLSVNVGMAVA
ncbi:MAG: MFS transporter, partial [Candidatus Limnocylindrales bacterium]|nr:MFS transporter [Candidatus Limnocylindrales bacterium]